MTAVRHDFREILRLVRPGARVLDVGSGSGELLSLLREEKGVDGRGLEIGAEGVAACLARGLAVMQGDADRDLGEYPDQAFDYAILSQTLQAVRAPRTVLAELLRLADRAIVSFPNFGHWRVRWALIASGRMPETRALPEPWWATPNIHLCTLRDFTDLCADMGLKVEAAAALTAGKPARPMDPLSPLETWRAEAALLMLSKTTRAAPEAWREVAMPPPTRAGDLFGG
ncbi:methionine biosynthesis protein MetW [soil metagenome]